MMNKAASWVVKTLAALSAYYMLLLGIYPFFKITPSDGFDRAGAMALGALIGVIGKTGMDAALEKLKEKPKGVDKDPE